MNMKRGRNLRNARGGQARWDSKSGTENAGKRVAPANDMPSSAVCPILFTVYHFYLAFIDIWFIVMTTGIGYVTGKNMDQE